ncbi:sOS-response transcriptional repressors (RecA-mediated autopeptidases) [Ruminococcus sp. CAG:579]|nr:sOS-response transcriptional repressors (RecA-mediated autopeptidases) [Ruminococcus sp. CAG:579]
MVIVYKMRNTAYKTLDNVTHIVYNITQQKMNEVFTMFDNRLKELRQKRKLNMKQAAQQLGIPYTTYVGYEKNEREPNSEVLLQLANFYNCSVDYLLGMTPQINSGEAATEETIFDRFDNIKPLALKKFPMLGEIACGEPIYADEDKETYVMADSDIKADFCLKAKGESMINARIYDGDLVFIKKMPMVENGDIAAVIIEDEATLKRVYYYPDQNKLILNPENSAFDPLVYIGEELNHIHILGKAVFFMSAL